MVQHGMITTLKPCHWPLGVAKSSEGFDAFWSQCNPPSGLKLEFVVQAVWRDSTKLSGENGEMVPK